MSRVQKKRMLGAGPSRIQPSFEADKPARDSNYIRAGHEMQNHLALVNRHHPPVSWTDLISLPGVLQDLGKQLPKQLSQLILTLQELTVLKLI